MAKLALEIALRFIKFRPRSRFEVERKLNFKKIPPEEIHKTISKLEKAGILNDLEFAKMWVRDRNLLKPRGRKLLFLELRKLGVDEGICEKAIDEEDIPDLKKARIIVKNKMNLINNSSSNEVRKRIIGILLRKGFTWETINKVIHK